VARPARRDALVLKGTGILLFGSALIAMQCTMLCLSQASIEERHEQGLAI
jgi:hypothetical protein